MSEAMELAHDRIMDIEATPKAASLTLSGDPVELIQNATRIATALADVIEKKHLYIQLGKKKHVYVEGWTTLLAMQGCLPREESVVELPDGRYVATVAYVQMATGVVVTRASAECGGPEEELWQKRPPFTRRSMAITRAAGKGARLAYSWIMTLAGYEATPAEEMDGVKAQFVTPPTPVGTMGALGVGTRLRSGDPHYVQPQRATVPFVPASAPSAREPGDESDIPPADDEPPPIGVLPVRNVPSASVPAGSPSVTGTIDHIAEKPTKTGGVKFGLKIGDGYVNTFSVTVGDAAKAAKAAKEVVEVFYADTKWGRDVEYIVTSAGTFAGH